MCVTFPVNLTVCLKFAEIVFHSLGRADSPLSALVPAGAVGENAKKYCSVVLIEVMVNMATFVMSGHGKLMTAHGGDDVIDIA